jgi:uncharacterized LabA/DUF88 family protein
MNENISRVIAYIDGFNLYFGLKSKSWKRYYWLNIRLMAENLLRRNQRLLYTKYFTSRVSNNAEKQKRQNIFIDAVCTQPQVKIFYGKYQMNPRVCNSCGVSELIPNEKMTDVNIAVELLADAFSDAFDTALLISADSDLVAPVRKVRSLFPQKKIVACFPPGRYSDDLKNAADISMHIGRRIIAESQFPDEVIRTADGFVLRRPSRWR